MNRTPEEHGLRVGRRFKLLFVTRVADGQLEIRRKGKGVVLEMFPHIFVAQMDGRRYKECFPYSMLEASQGGLIRPI